MDRSDVERGVCSDERTYRPFFPELLPSTSAMIRAGIALHPQRNVLKKGTMVPIAWNGYSLRAKLFFSRPIRVPKERSRFDRWFHRIFYIVHGSSYRKKLFLMSMPVDRRVLDNSNAFLPLISVISEIPFSGLTVVEGRSLDLIVCAAR